MQKRRMTSPSQNHSTPVKRVFHFLWQSQNRLQQAILVLGVGPQVNHSDPHRLSVCLSAYAYIIYITSV